MTTAQKLFVPLAFLLAFTLTFSTFVVSVSANHPAEATTLVETEDAEEEHDDDHGLQTAVAATDVAQLKAYIALLTQLIELLNKQIALKGGSSEAHTDDHDDDHHDDDADEHDDDDSEDDADDDHEDDSEDDHDED